MSSWIISTRRGAMDADMKVLVKLEDLRAETVTIDPDSSDRVCENIAYEKGADFLMRGSFGSKELWLYYKNNPTEQAPASR